MRHGGRAEPVAAARAPFRRDTVVDGDGLPMFTRVSVDPPPGGTTAGSAGRPGPLRPLHGAGDRALGQALPQHDAGPAWLRRQRQARPGARRAGRRRLAGTPDGSDGTGPRHAARQLLRLSDRRRPRRALSRASRTRRPAGADHPGRGAEWAPAVRSLAAECALQPATWTRSRTRTTPNAGWCAPLRPSSSRGAIPWRPNSTRSGRRSWWCAAWKTRSATRRGRGRSPTGCRTAASRSCRTWRAPRCSPPRKTSPRSASRFSTRPR